MSRMLDRPHQLICTKESILVRLAFIIHAGIAKPAAAWPDTRFFFVIEREYAVSALTTTAFCWLSCWLFLVAP